MSTQSTLVVAGIIVSDGRVLAAQRSYPDALAGRWEFPGGKAEPGEDARAALVRELREELGVIVAVGAELPGPDAECWPINERLHMRAFWCHGGDAAVVGEGHHLLRWVEPEDLPELDWLPADVPLAAVVRHHLLDTASD